jgi:hypothetical protein
MSSVAVVLDDAPLPAKGITSMRAADYVQQQQRRADLNSDQDQDAAGDGLLADLHAELQHLQAAGVQVQSVASDDDDADDHACHDLLGGAEAEASVHEWQQWQLSLPRSSSLPGELINMR